MERLEGLENANWSMTNVWGVMVEEAGQTPNEGILVCFLSCAAKILIVAVIQCTSITPRFCCSKVGTFG